MRLVSFKVDDRSSWGALEGDRIRDLGDKRYPTLRSALQAEAVDRLISEAQKPSLHLDTVYLLSPIPNPSKILAVGVNFREHALEIGLEISPYPILFSRYNTSLVPPGSPIVKPVNSCQLDYEGELAVVLGKRAYRVSVEEAELCIAGYSCFADNSVRDFQQHSSQVLPGKNFDSSGSWGPLLATRDELPDFASARIETRLNGSVVQADLLSSMILSPEQIIAYVSTFLQLEPGDVIATGTPSGIGWSRNPPQFLMPGDELEVQIDGIGTLRNKVVNEEDVSSFPARLRREADA